MQVTQCSGLGHDIPCSVVVTGKWLVQGFVPLSLAGSSFPLGAFPSELPLRNGLTIFRSSAPTSTGRRSARKAPAILPRIPVSVPSTSYPILRTSKPFWTYNQTLGVYNIQLIQAGLDPAFPSIGRDIEH